ncbi:MAG TPA: hypothetical protein VHJ69_03930 [Gemmatimonadales bacterium]|nr:hypothetical protein [Gemmatimonadales bacterium]
MRGLGRLIALLIAVARFGFTTGPLGTDATCDQPAAGHHSRGHAGAHHQAPAGGSLDVPGACTHCPSAHCAVSSQCGGGSTLQLAAPVQPAMTAAAAHTIPALPTGPLRSTSSSPPTPPPQAIG